MAKKTVATLQGSSKKLTKAEADFRVHPKLQDFIPSTDPQT